tara:strand:+ start:7158 stop:7436 length:279 start_codon:yes stop_codon:yes gene_type:complete
MMGFTWNQIGMAALASVLVFWPTISKLFSGVFSWLKKTGEKKTIEPEKVTFHQSLIALSTVRKRLVDAGGVASDADSAIEVLTHALLEGSEK